jgi:hypothetical protein
MMRIGTLIIILMLVIVSSIPTAFAGSNTKLYAIYDYGNLVIATINRSALTYLGNGYWLMVLPNMDAVSFSSKLVDEIIDKFIGHKALYSQLRITMTDNGYRIVKIIDILNTSDASDNEIMNTIMQALNVLRAREAWVLFLEGKVIRIDVAAENGIDVEKVAKILSGITRSYKIVVIETFGSGLPSYFDARDLYESLNKISCFFSVGESLYGVDMWFNISCIKELAIATNRSFDKTLEDVINSVKTLDPLIRKYLPYQNIVILVVQPPSVMPLPLGPEPIEKTKHTKTAEISTEAIEISQTPPDLTQKIFIISAIVVIVSIILALQRIIKRSKS